MLTKILTKPDAKKGSSQKEYQGPLSSGLNRRAFLKTSTAISLLGGLAACKPTVPKPISHQQNPKNESISTSNQIFTTSHQQSLNAVLMQLFPADGNGPSAQDINALNYLEWAMTDMNNIDDGDPDFIIKGIGWMEDLSQQTQGDSFTNLPSSQQDKVLKQISQSQAGENWLSLLMYYLTEALLLDPVYGGNTDRIGWQWLEHQAGFPQPEIGKTYRDFD
ncbi:gluconate 2-dehydrogenase subunit 3 family protein [Aliikangiella sp. IMCC44359]|uniref:gluconate 2-dehydrogenase subunit 3 family protein n=1 Tax=Aliikangiella sp. IMCC44359 TaxID=3459125 RepID=UPI00403AC7F3